MGIGILTPFIARWFFNKGYMHFLDYKSNKIAYFIIGDLEKYETRANWYLFFYEYLVKLCILYVGVVIYYSI